MTETQREQKNLESMNYLNSGCGMVGNQQLRAICETVLQDKLFQQGLGAQHRHHAYPGGLPVHVAEVLKIALSTASAFHNVNYDVLITATICHDYCKIYDYYQDEKGEIQHTRYAKEIRHLAGSYAWFMEKANLYRVEASLIQAVGHAMLAHHGRREWGSPIEPQTVEAAILHYADMLSREYGEGR